MTTTSDINYKLVAPRSGVLLSPKTFQTPFRPTANIMCKACSLNTDGELVLRKGFIWDFASGAIDTPDMVIASAAHDALCRMVNERKIPKRKQKKIDKYFRELLKDLGTPWIRRWYTYLAVRLYQTIK